jgi:hypothetical protein
MMPITIRLIYRVAFGLAVFTIIMIMSRWP